MATHYEDVLAFHDKMRLPRTDCPTPALEAPNGRERVRHLAEELREYLRAVAIDNVAGQADALVDLVYIAIGNAIVQGLPWDVLWDAVHRANMQKIPDASRPKLVQKPIGWQPADIEAILQEALEDCA